jgi:hypothetical protein
MRVLLALVMIAASAVTAAADPVKVVTGAKRDDLVASVAQVRGLMSVCWQRKPPATIKIALTVAASGDVTKATAKTKGAAAQCAAGILAVSTLAIDAAWKGVVAIEPTEAGKSKDVRLIQQALSSQADDFYACQKKATAFAGKVTLRVTVAQSGAVTAASAEADAAAGKPVASCVAGIAKKLTLVEIESPSITYDLTLSFAGGDTASSDQAADPDLQPSKKGPLEVDDLMPVIGARRAAIEKCAKGTKARGKVVVRVAIGDDGKVTKAKIKSSELDSTTVEDCLVKVFSAMTFRAASGETVVIYPIRIDDDGVKTGG